MCNLRPSSLCTPGVGTLMGRSVALTLSTLVYCHQNECSIGVRKGAGQIGRSVLFSETKLCCEILLELHFVSDQNYFRVLFWHCSRFFFIDEFFLSQGLPISLFYSILLNQF